MWIGLRELATSVDILFRRIGVGWSKTMGVEAARMVAETAAVVFGWDNARVKAKVVAYNNHLAQQHTCGDCRCHDEACPGLQGE